MHEDKPDFDWRSLVLAGKIARETQNLGLERPLLEDS